MPAVGPLEILMVSVVALIVFGPEKLPEIARTVGKALADFRRVVDDAKSEFQAGMDFDDDAPAYHPIRETLDDPPVISGHSDPDDGSTDMQSPAPGGARSMFDTETPATVPADRPPKLTPIPMTLERDPSGEEPDNA
jgi:sec-independent protein translocase protein TatB